MVKDKCASAMSWLDANNLAEKEEFEHQYKELQKACSPIMSKMHGAGGGNSTTSGGPEPSPSAAGGNKGPTVEEVD